MRMRKRALKRKAFWVIEFFHRVVAHVRIFAPLYSFFLLTRIRTRTRSFR